MPLQQSMTGIIKIVLVRISILERKSKISRTNAEKIRNCLHKSDSKDLLTKD